VPGALPPRLTAPVYNLLKFKGFYASREAGTCFRHSFLRHSFPKIIEADLLLQ
jgi:hypothetical protein